MLITATSEFGGERRRREADLWRSSAHPPPGIRGRSLGDQHDAGSKWKSSNRLFETGEGRAWTMIEERTGCSPARWHCVRSKCTSADGKTVQEQRSVIIAIGGFSEAHGHADGVPIFNLRVAEAKWAAFPAEEGWRRLVVPKPAIRGLT